MQIARILVLSAAIAVAVAAAAAEKSFTTALVGWSRACGGGLFVRARTIEWNTPYSQCQSSPYEVLGTEDAADGKHRAFRLLKPGKRCLYPVIEVVQFPDGNWDVIGYQTLESYQKRELADWRVSPLPERQLLSCPMSSRD